jgi:DNA-binding NarL/FixJ family response regulator
MGVSAPNSLQSRTRRPRVLVAIIGPLMRAAAEAFLEEHGFAPSPSGADATSVIERALRDRPDVVLIDRDLPGGGIRAVEHVVTALQDTAVLVLAEGPSDADVLDAVRAGAVGCLAKDISPDGLARAVWGALNGELAVPRELVGDVLTEIAVPDARLVYGGAWERVAKLTVRELQVLRLLARSASTANITRELDISPITARRHCAAICRKLKVPDRASAVRLIKDAERPRFWPVE